MQLDFIHIGLGKCMSSRLQGLWELDETYNAFSGREIAGAVDQLVANHTPGGSDIETDIAKINLDFPATQKDTTNILTSEDFTFSHLHDATLGEVISVKDQAASKLLGGMTGKILMLVRDPIDWIRSCYAQQVKEGGSIALAAYMRSHRDVILNNLNLKRRIDLWSRFGAEVVVLPIEMAKRSNAEFWETYETRLGVSRPSNWDKSLGAVGENITGYGKIEPHRRINELLQLLETSLDQSEDDQKPQMIKYLKASRRLCARRAFSYADEAVLGKIYASLDLSAEACSIDEITLDEAYTSAIEEGFLEPLREDRFFQTYGCLDAYSAQLKEALR